MLREHAGSDLVKLRGGDSFTHGFAHRLQRQGDDAPGPLQPLHIFFGIDRHSVSCFLTEAES